MISVTLTDRDVLWFLWVDNTNKDSPEVTTMTFRRVMFGVSASPFLLNATIKYHIERYQAEDPEFVSQFLRSIYVNDVVFGATSIQEVFKLYSKSKTRLSLGGFNLWWFTTNSPELRKQLKLAENRCTTDVCSHPVSEEDCSYTQSTLGDHRETLDEKQKVLGVRWNFVNDCFVFDIQHLAEQAESENPTKRNVVSLTARFYDPLCVLSPCNVLFKLFLQSLWLSGIDWDQPLSGELLSSWRCLINYWTEESTSYFFSELLCYRHRSCHVLQLTWVLWCIK